MHCHLDLYPDAVQLVQQIARAKAYVLSVTTTPKAWQGTVALAKGHARIKTALGLHPQLAGERKGELALFDTLLPETRYVGEVGLDGSPECRPFWRDQVRVFDHILASCTKAGGRILTIHSRAAATEVMDALERHPGAGIPILHWFSGTETELKRAIAMGCWFSVGPAMLKSKKGQALASIMPPHRVLTETDGPFGTSKNQPLMPGDVANAVDVLALSWDLSSQEVGEKVLQSFRSLVVSL